MWRPRPRHWAVVRLAGLCAQPEERPVLLVLIMAAGFLFWKARYLVYPDLAFTYPFITYDGFQWILDSGIYLGRDVTATYRNPALPVLVACLDRLGAVRYLPLLTTALLGVFFVYLTLLLREHHRPSIVALTVALLFFNFTVQTIYDFVLADQWAITCQMIAIYHLRRAKDGPRQLLLFAFWIAVSFSFQYAVAFVAPAFLYYYLTEIRPGASSRRAVDRTALLAVCLGLLLALPPFLYKWKKFGNPFFSHVTHFPLLKPHFFGMVYYGVNVLAFFGIPTAALVVYGFCKGLRKNGFIGTMNLCIVCWVVFWVFLYSWLDSRFILYALPFAAFALAEGLHQLDVPSFWSWKTQPFARTLVGCGLVLLALLYSLYDRGSPFASNRLPLSPQNVLVFGIVPIARWEANVTIDVAGWRIENATEGVPALHFLRRYYAEHRRRVPDARIEEQRELLQLATVAERTLGAKYRLAACGKLADDYYSRMRREITLGRTLGSCTDRADARLEPAGEAKAVHPLFAGRNYLLTRISEPDRPGSFGAR